MISAPSSTVLVPRWPFRSVAVYPGSARLNLMPGRALAYCTVSMLSAVLEEP